MAVITTTEQIAADLNPADTDEAVLYTYPANTMGTLVLRITHQDNKDKEYSVAHLGSTGTTARRWMFKNRVTDERGEPHEVSIHGNAGDRVIVKSEDPDNIYFHLSGRLKEVS